MQTRRLVLVVTAILAVGLGHLSPNSLRAQTSIALTGTVVSTEEGSMEGVLVSAKKTGSTVTITVVSDQQGRYRFRRAELGPGQYALRIRAAGYDLDDPGTVEIASSSTATVDLKLRKARDLASQLTSAEWLESVPGTQEQKISVQICVSCHTLERVVRSRYDATTWLSVLARMGSYANMSFPLFPQFEANAAEQQSRPPTEQQRRQAEFLSTVNLSSRADWEYSLKTFRRPTGRATQVVYTEYDLPRPVIQPHDVIVDTEGMVWFNNFGEQYVGKLDPKTGKVSEYPMPRLRPDQPTGTLDLIFDKDQNMWSGMMFQEGIARFDRKTETFQTWSVPAEYRDRTRLTRVAPQSHHVDGKVWMVNSGSVVVHRLDVASGKFDTFEPFRGTPGNHNIYGINVDSQNNAYFMYFSHEHIGRIDAKTGEITLYRTPTPRSAPRRGMMDSQDRLWFGEHRGNGIGMFDTRTTRFQEWAAPTPWSWPYDATVDRTGDVWAGGMFTDRVLRLDPRSGQFTEYLLPRSTNIRRVFVDNKTTPVTFWVGSNHGATIVKLEPLDAPLEPTTSAR